MGINIFIVFFIVVGVIGVLIGYGMNKIKNRKKTTDVEQDLKKFNSKKIFICISIVGILILGVVLYFNFFDKKKNVIGQWQNDFGVVLNLYDDGGCRIIYEDLKLNNGLDDYADNKSGNCSYTLNGYELLVEYESVTIFMGQSVTTDEKLEGVFADDYKTFKVGKATYRKN